MKKIITVFIFCLVGEACFSQAGEWVWIKGDSVPNMPGNFGVQGVPSPTNNPPSLYEPCEWTDLNGNFWLFGGADWNRNVNNDLWKYTPLTNEWTWIKGSGIINSLGNYGTIGIPSITNLPPSRGWGITSWTDNVGDLWMYGGAADLPGTYADLWKYTIAANEWTWMKGPNVTNQPSVYGSQGIPSPLNEPGSRSECSAAWTDNTSNLWLFGGADTNANAVFNDLWKYNISTNQWTWMKGAQLTSQNGTYGIEGLEDSLNTPGSRWAYCHWKDNNGSFWLLGGLQSQTNAYYNDLWRYNPVSDNWAWMDGDSTTNTLGTYGSKCIISPNDMIGSRMENRVCWRDQYGNFWGFGGYYGINDIYFNDLWTYNPTYNQWIWQSGDSSWISTGHWGTLGISSTINVPSGRFGSVGWTDLNGHLYLFGGWVRPTGLGYYFINDLWKYTIDTACIPTNVQEHYLLNELLVFPNPANSSFTVSFSSAERQCIEFRLYSTLGEDVYFSEEKIVSGKFEKEINVKNLSNGIYLLRVKIMNGVLSKKVLVY